MLGLSSRDLREEIYREVNENPALKIVKDPGGNFNQNQKNQNSGVNGGNFETERYSENYSRGSGGGDLESALEATEGHKETLQQHLMSQLNMSRVTSDEYDLCQKLIYNLDKNGCYGSMLAPETFLDRKRPLQTKAMLERCIKRIQQMDPVGTCCKNLFESLFVQAKLAGNAPQIALFLLDGHLELMNPPTVERVLHKLNEFKANYHRKSFGGKLILDQITLNEKTVEESIKYIQSLNMRPAGEYISDISAAEFEQPDIVLNVVKVEGHISEDDFGNGKIATSGSFYFQVKYASGILPEIQIVPEANFDKESIERARAFLGNLQFRQNTIVLQGCAIVSAQKEFFIHGPGNIVPLTRKQIAKKLNIHESTVSRMSAKKSSKYIQTEWGLFPASYFFSSGVKKVAGAEHKIDGERGISCGELCTATEHNIAGEHKTTGALGISAETDIAGPTVLSYSTKISAEAVQFKIQKIEENAQKSGEKLSDNQITKMLNDEGIKIARRTVAKYRQRAGLKNSYGK